MQFASAIEPFLLAKSSEAAAPGSRPAIKVRGQAKRPGNRLSTRVCVSQVGWVKARVGPVTNQPCPACSAAAHGDHRSTVPASLSDYPQLGYRMQETAGRSRNRIRPPRVRPRKSPTTWSPPESGMLGATQRPSSDSHTRQPAYGSRFVSLFAFSATS